MSLLVQLTTLLSILSISVAHDAPDIASIAMMANDLIASEQAATTVKEWTLDWQSDPEEVRSSLKSIGPTVDPKKLLQDILVDDGHDEESDVGESWAARDVTGRCGCCSSMKMFSTMYAPTTILRQPLFNGLAQTVCNRLVTNVKRSGLEPMPLLLRRRSVQETAYLLHTRQHFKRSISINPSIQVQSADRDGKSHDTLFESAMWDTPTVRVLASLAGLSTLRRTGDDVQTMMLPNGRTMLRINMVAGPLQLTVPSAEVPDAAQNSGDQPQTSSQVTVAEEVSAEMNLILHPRQGLVLHSFRFSNQTKFSTDLAVAFAQATRIPFRASGIHVVDNGNEAAVAQQLRRLIRQTLRSS